MSDPFSNEKVAEDCGIVFVERILRGSGSGSGSGRKRRTLKNACFIKALRRCIELKQKEVFPYTLDADLVDLVHSVRGEGSDDFVTPILEGADDSVTPAAEPDLQLHPAVKRFLQKYSCNLRMYVMNNEESDVLFYAGFTRDGIPISFLDEEDPAADLCLILDLEESHWLAYPKRVEITLLNMHTRQKSKMDRKRNRE